MPVEHTEAPRSGRREFSDRWKEWRVLGEMAAYPLARIWLTKAPKGDGHPVMVLPGLWADDKWTWSLRNFLEGRDYEVYGWGLGRNRGPQSDMAPKLTARLQAIAAQHQTKVSLIGWSLGGVFARELARDNSSIVRSVITLGSPFRLAAPIGMMPQRHNPQDWAAASGDPFFIGRMRVAPPVPTTSIYSKEDGIVNWQASLEENSQMSENIEVPSTHFGLPLNPFVLYAVADRLAQKPDSFAPFQPPAWFEKGQTHFQKN